MGERLDEALARVTDLRDRGIGAVESMDGFESVYGETAMEVLLEFDRELRAALDYEYILEANVKGLEAEWGWTVDEVERARAEVERARRERDAAWDDLKDAFDGMYRTRAHLPPGTGGPLDEAVGAHVAALTARAERAEAAARALHEEAISQAVEKVGIWNGLDYERARAERAEAEVRRLTDWAARNNLGLPEVDRG